MARRHALAVSSKERAQDRGSRNAQRLLNQVGTELREARLISGTSQRVVSGAAGISISALSRIERADAPWVSIPVLARLAAVVGLDLYVRLYPGGEPVRDAAHRQLLERLRARISSTLTWRTEVPLPLERDQRAWDALIGGEETGPDGRVRRFLIGVEAETRLRDVQALQRRLALKRRDGGVDHLILLVADTRSNRALTDAEDGSLFPDLPMAPVDALRALRDGRSPLGSALIRL